MGTETLNSSTNTGITLTSSGTYTSPFTVTTSGAVVTGADFAVYSTLAGAALSNLGTLTATVASDAVGVLLDEGGTILNSGGGLIAGHLDGVLVNGAAGTVTNAGKISATIRDAIQLNDGGTVINTGTIAGAVAIAGAGGDRVVAGNGAVFTGTVAAAGTGNTLEFAGSGSTVASIGTQFTGFQTIAFDPASAWTISGTETEFAGLASISGVGLGDVIDVTDFAATAASYTAGVGLVLKNSTTSDTLTIGDAYGHFSIASDSHGGTDIFGEVQQFATTSTLGITLTPNGAYRVPFAVTSAGTIVTSGATGIYSALGATLLFNGGSISAKSDGVLLTHGGTVINTGIIDGNASSGSGVLLQDGGTVINAGTIAGATAVYLGSSNGARLVAETGAAFLGLVKAAGTNNTLEFAGTGQSLVSFTGFQTIDFDPGAAWGIEADAAQLAALATIAGHPGLIDLTGFAATVASYTAGIGLVLSNATGSTTLHVGAEAGYNIKSDGNGGTVIRFPYFVTASTVGLTATPFNEFYVTGSGVTVTDATVDSQDLLVVDAGNTLTNAKIDAGGTQASYDAILTNTAIYGQQIVSGGTETNSTLHGNAKQTIYSAVVTNAGLGGYQYVHSGSVTNSGSIYNQIVYNGTITNSGEVSNQTVDDGVVLNDHGAGLQVVTGGTVTNYGPEHYQYINNGFVTNFGNVSGKQVVYGGTTDNDGVLFEDKVYGGTVAGNFEVEKQLTVYGGTVTGTVQVQQTLTVYGGTAQDATLGSGATLYLNPPLGAAATVQNVVMTDAYQNNFGGVVIGTTITGGKQLLHARYLRQFVNDTYYGVITLGTGVAIDSTLTNSYQELGGVHFDRTLAGHNGSQYVYSYGGGKAIDTVLYGGKQSVGTNIYKDIHPADVSGTFTIDALGYVLNTTFNTGTQIVHLTGTVREPLRSMIS